MVPDAAPFTYHWYAGVVPPLIGDAVNVTTVGPQTGLADGVTATATGRFGRTAMVTVFDMAGLPNVHGSLEVS